MKHKISIGTSRRFKHLFSLKRTVKRCVKRTLKSEGIALKTEMNVLLTDNEGIRELNRDFRKKDTATDVLSFPANQLDKLLKEAIREAEVLDYDYATRRFALGDIAISIERMHEQAAEYGHSVKREMGFLTVHGCLHLLGYDHIQPDEEKQMRARQQEILNELGLKR